MSANKTISDLQCKQAIQIILDDSKSYNTSLNWAVCYCRTAMELSGEDLRTQVLYILNNITHWRHPQAKDVRKVLRSYVSQAG